MRREETKSENKSEDDKKILITEMVRNRRKIRIRKIKKKTAEEEKEEDLELEEYEISFPITALPYDSYL